MNNPLTDTSRAFDHRDVNEHSFSSDVGSFVIVGAGYQNVCEPGGKDTVVFTLIRDFDPHSEIKYVELPLGPDAAALLTTMLASKGKAATISTKKEFRYGELHSERLVGANSHTPPTLREQELASIVAGEVISASLLHLPSYEEKQEARACSDFNEAAFEGKAADARNAKRVAFHLLADFAPNVPVDLKSVREWVYDELVRERAEPGFLMDVSTPETSAALVRLGAEINSAARLAGLDDGLAPGFLIGSQPPRRSAEQEQ